jgi:polyketide biosynthesis 3-hydroxy-3-methylglutaryl-CoA synthase-like enzyme PksG
MALGFVLSQASAGAKALVVATDIARFIAAEPGKALSEDWSFAEPSSGAGAMAMLVSSQPHVFRADIGANGYYGYEVMDTCRPTADSDAGDSDLSLLSYLDCCEASFREYAARVRDAEYRRSFNYLAFHTPFGGMVKGAHRTMMRKLAKASPAEIETDFLERVTPGLKHCQRVGNIMGGTVFLALASTIDHGDFSSPRRIGCFSYGSGCCSEFYSGIVTAEGQSRLRRMAIGRHLDARHNMTIDEYEEVLRGSAAVRFGTRNVVLDRERMSPACLPRPGQKRLYLREIREFHREYEWV